METSNVRNGYSSNSSESCRGLSGLSGNPGFRQLIEYYQSGKFSKCIKLIKELEEQYPQHPELLRLRENIELKSSIRSMTASIYKKENREKIRGFFRFGNLMILLVIFVLLISVFSYDYIKNNFWAGLTQDEKLQLGVLDAQVEQLLSEGEPEAAAEKLERIREIDPKYENIPDMEVQIYNLLLLKMEYQNAMGLLEDGKDAEALSVLMNIEQENPGLWDVYQQITLIRESSTP